VKRNFTVVIEKDKDGGYVGIVPGIPGAHTQSDSIDELYVHLREVIELCLEEMDEEEINDIPDFFSVSQVEVAV
jgi:predicted RNase H-like HicB family nuclease